jgi:transcriptional regulator with XRE-family HTH domain
MVTQRLAALVRAQGLTQTRLARLTGYRQTDISRLLRGAMKFPPLAMLDSVARVCGFSLAQILDDVMPSPLMPPDVAQVSAALQAMPSADRAAMVRVVLDAAAGAERRTPSGAQSAARRAVATAPASKIAKR